MDDKKKILILKIIIIFVSIIIALTIGMIFLVNNNKRISNYVSTTKRRTYTTTSTTTTTTEEIEETTITTTTSTTKNKTVVVSDPTKPKETSPSDANTTTTTTTVKIEEITTKGHNITSSYSDYPGINNEWVFNILNLINNERTINGYNKLEMDADLRRLAEEAADIYTGNNAVDVKNYINGYSHYIYANNNLKEDGYQVIFNKTKEKTDLCKNHSKYVGIAVLNKEHGLNGMPTINYIIIYE